jgi:hypothetical protein
MNWRPIPAAGIAVYVLSVVLVSFYQIGGADEGVWLYASWLVSQGRMPVLDFLSQHPVGAFLPYAAAMRLLSPGIEAARLVSAGFACATTLMAAALVWRWAGRRAGAVTFVLLACNVGFQWTQMSVYSVSPMAFGLTAAVFCLLWPRRVTIGHALLAGLAIGIAGAARLPACAEGLAVAVFLLAQRDRPAAWRLGAVAAAGAMAVVPLIPEIVTFAKAPDLFMFQRWEIIRGYLALVLGDMNMEPTPWNWMWTAIAGWPAFLWSGSFHAPHQNAGIAVLGAAALLGVVRHGKAAVSERTAWSLFFLAAAAALANIGWLVLLNSFYLVFLTPLLAIAIGFLAGDVLRAWGNRRWVAAFGLAVLAPYCAMGVAHGAWQVLLRHNGGFTMPTTQAAAACWLRAAVPPGRAVFAAWPAALPAAGRMLPAGLESAGVSKAWYYLDPEVSDRIGLPSRARLASLFASGEVPVILDDTVIDILDRPYMPGLISVIDANYTGIGAIGDGRFAIRVLVHRSVDAAGLPPLPRLSATNADMALLREQGALAFASALGRDLGASLIRLPADVAASARRIVGAGPCP